MMIHTISDEVCLGALYTTEKRPNSHEVLNSPKWIRQVTSFPPHSRSSSEDDSSGPLVRPPEKCVMPRELICFWVAPYDLQPRCFTYSVPWNKLRFGEFRRFQSATFCFQVTSSLVKTSHWCAPKSFCTVQIESMLPSKNGFGEFGDDKTKDHQWLPRVLERLVKLHPPGEACGRMLKRKLYI